MENRQKESYDKKRYLYLKNERIKELPPDPIKFLTPVQRAYIAGIIDGEGSIYARNERKTIYPTLAIHMTDRSVIEWIQNLVHGQKVWELQRRDSVRYKRLTKKQYLFRICGKRLQILCKSILPYLIVKKTHAIIVNEWPIDVRKWNRTIPDNIQKTRKLLGDKLTQANGNSYKIKHGII